ncbi:MAG: YgcG family protein [Pseudomonas sp.]
MAYRLLIVLLLALVPGLLPAQQLAAIPALGSPVVDQTGTLDAAQKQRLEQQALALQQSKGSQLQVLIVASTQPETIEEYTQRVFDAWKLGRKGVDDGVLLVVAKDDRRVRIQPGYGLEGAIPDAIANRVIQEYLVPQFRQGDYAGGIEQASAVLVKLIEGEDLPAPVSAQDAKDDADPIPVSFILRCIGVFLIIFWFMFDRRSTLDVARGGSGGSGRIGGGGWSGGGGGGWSGGGGSSGGGGASGSW